MTTRTTPGKKSTTPGPGVTISSSPSPMSTTPKTSAEVRHLAAVAWLTTTPSASAPRSCPCLPRGTQAARTGLALAGSSS